MLPLVLLSVVIKVNELKLLLLVVVVVVVVVVVAVVVLVGTVVGLQCATAKSARQPDK